MIAGTWMEIVNCQIRRLDSRVFLNLKEKPPDGCTWSGERLTRKHMTSRPDKLWPEMWKHMSDASKRKEKQNWTNEKPKVVNARRLRGIYFIDPQRCLVKLQCARVAGKPAAILENTRLNNTIGRCAAQVSRRSHLCKRNKFNEPLQSCAQISSDASSKKKSGCNGSSGKKDWKNWRRYRHGSWRKSETKMRWLPKQGMRAEKYILRH